MENTIREFIKYIVKFDNIDDILDKCQTQSEKGIVFERLFDIVIKFGFCDVFPNSQFTHLCGNSNTCKLKPLKLNKYLTKSVNSSKEGGCSDITLLDKTTDEYIFITSKYPKTNDDIKKQKSVNYYDIANIVAMVDNNKHMYQKYKIYLTVPNKKQVLDKVKRANVSSEYITKYMIDTNILDKTDLNKYFLKFKEDIIPNIDSDLSEIYSHTKESLELRFHQELITSKTSDLITRGNKSFLWGCKCRSGKTYMVGGIINKRFNLTGKLNVLVITPAPTETIPQFTDDLFNKFKQFDKFKIHVLTSNYIKSIKTKSIKLGTNNIFIVSKQLLQKYTNEKSPSSKGVIKKIKKLKLDMIIFDENHFGGTTDISGDILNTYSCDNTVRIYLTATYNKPLHQWDITKECQMYWDIEDEQICKSILDNDSNGLVKLKSRHTTKYVDSTIKHYMDLGLSLNDMFNVYTTMPELYLMSNMFDSQRYIQIMENIQNSCYGFSFEALFSLKSDNKFKYESEVKNFLRYISGSQKEQDYKTGDKSIFGRLKNMDSRTPFTQIWFLPSEHIKFVSDNLKDLMEQDKILKEYNVMCINRGDDKIKNVKDIKSQIEHIEYITTCEGKRGLIILAGSMLNLGITISTCDVVMLMNDTLSSDKIMQQMWRCMTEAPNKKRGYVVDMNPNRILQTCINYKSEETDLEKKFTYLIESNMINIDVDTIDNPMFENGKINSDKIIKKLLDIWQNDPINNIQTFLKNIANDYIVFDNETQKKINILFANSINDNIVKTNFDILSDQLIPKGIKKTKKLIASESESEDSDSESEDSELDYVSFSKDVLPYLIPLICILTIKDRNKDLINMLNYIKNNKELFQIFDNQCSIWWNNKNLMNMITEIFKKYNVSLNVDTVCLQIKLQIQNLLDQPNELLNLISDCLKPRTQDTKTFGEVFTPMEFINNKMLRDIEVYWLNKYKENIWNNETLTWYDPCAGMGNYPIAIYYKLMDGLQDKIPNKSKRSKHIIEKQLYMGELNKKNCFIIKQIFNIHNKYKLNLYEGDTLNINFFNEFNKSKFDIIISNPPYNEEFNKAGGARPLYNKFIEYYVDKCKLLSYIVPSRWFSAGKGLDKFRAMMLNRKDIVYINHYNDATKIFGNTVEIKGGVNYFLIDKYHNDLCEYKTFQVHPELYNGTKMDISKYDILLDSKYYDIVNKISEYPHKLIKNYINQSYYKIKSNDTRLITSDSDKYDSDTFIKCYVSQQKGFIKYIDKTEIEKDCNNFKIITARANGNDKGAFGNTFIGKPNEVHSQSYISFNVDSENEAKSLLSYMKCKLPHFMLVLRKSSQDICESTCKWIPLPPLNREWTNSTVYSHFKLTPDEIKLITETKIHGYKSG